MWIKDTIKRLDRKYLNRFLFRRLHTRRIHLYCTGSLKSGTHSICKIFKKNYRSRHEPDNDELVELYLKLNKKNLSKKKLERIALKREKRLYLEVNSSSFNYIILDQLLQLYPKAKFIHTIREPRAWLESWINHYINYYINDETIQAIPIEKEYFADLFKRDKFTHSRKEKILEELKMPTIDGMLSYWQKHNQFILEKVPDSRLLVIKTQNISHKINSIIKFAGLEKIPGKINSHAFKARKKHDILSQIDTNYLEEKLNKYSLEFVKW